MTISCIPKSQVDNLVRDIKSGKIDVKKLRDMASGDRRSLFSTYFDAQGESGMGKFANIEYERSLLRKDQVRAEEAWIKKMKAKPEVKKKLNNQVQKFSDKVSKMERELSPKDQEKHLEDLAESRLGLSLSDADALKLFDLSAVLEKTKEGTPEFGEAFLNLEEYMKEITPVPPLTLPQKIYENLFDILSLPRGLKTAFDVSGVSRQGGMYLGGKEWIDMVKHLQKGPDGGPGYLSPLNGAEAMRNLKKRIYSHPQFRTIWEHRKALGMTTLGVHMSEREEAVASRWLAKIPGVAHSARAYEGGLNDLRFNVFANLMDRYAELGDHPMMTDPDMQRDLAKAISAASGRGHLGDFEAVVEKLNAGLFSTKWAVSRFQIFTNPITKLNFGPGKTMTPAAKEASLALGKMMAIQASLTGLAMAVAAMSGDDEISGEINPLSSDFGKFRVDNTRFDISAGSGSYVVLMARLASWPILGDMSRKDTETKKIQKLDERQRVALLVNFLSNKSAPIPAVIRDYYRGRDFDYDPVNFDQPASEHGLKLLNDLAVPFILSTTHDAFNEATEDTISKELMASIVFGFEALGIGSSTYTPRKPKRSSRSRRSRSRRRSRD